MTPLEGEKPTVQRFEHIENYYAAGPHEVFPLSAVQALAEWCDDKAHMARAERDCHPDQSRIDYCDGEAHAWEATARRLRSLTNPNKEDGPDE